MIKSDTLLLLTIVISLIIGCLLVFYQTYYEKNEQINAVEVASITSYHNPKKGNMLNRFLLKNGIHSTNLFLEENLMSIKLSLGNKVTYQFKNGKYIVLNYDSQEIVDYDF